MSVTSCLESPLRALSPRTRRIAIVLVLGLLAAAGILSTISPERTQLRVPNLWPGARKNVALPLPVEYSLIPDASAQSESCNNKFGTNYLRMLGRSAYNYCKDNSPALTCFNHSIVDARLDTFCFGGPGVVDASQKSFSLECSFKGEDGPALKGPDRFPVYFFDTGPGITFNEYIEFVEPRDSRSIAAEKAKGPPVLILVKREGPGDALNNIWHTYMQLMSILLSIDVLKSTRDPATGAAYWTELDSKMSQVVILDDYDEGSLFHLWSAFFGLPVVRADKLPQGSSYSKVVIPLGGSSNPIWDTCWTEFPCDDSALLKTFSRRLLDLYNATSLAPTKSSTRPLSLTFIDRRGKRKLTNIDPLFATLQKKYESIHMQLIDFATIPLAEQIAIARSSDILVGVHGAGMMHNIFLTPGSSLVEIMPHNLGFKGFMDMAIFNQVNYFTESGDVVEGAAGDWQFDDVYLDETVFMAMMDKAIAAARS